MGVLTEQEVEFLVRLEDMPYKGVDMEESILPVDVPVKKKGGRPPGSGIGHYTISDKVKNRFGVKKKRKTRLHPRAKHNLGEQMKELKGNNYKAANVKEALRLRVEGGLTYKEIAKLQGVTPRQVEHAVKKLMPDGGTEIFKKNRADILSKLQQTFLTKAVDKKKLSKSSTSALVDSAKKCFEMERLERGQSTTNVDLHSLMYEIKKNDLLEEIESEEADVVE